MQYLQTRRPRSDVGRPVVSLGRPQALSERTLEGARGRLVDRRKFRCPPRWGPASGLPSERCRTAVISAALHPLSGMPLSATYNASVAQLQEYILYSFAKVEIILASLILVTEMMRGCLVCAVQCRRDCGWPVPAWRK